MCTGPPLVFEYMGVAVNEIIHHGARHPPQARTDTLLQAWPWACMNLLACTEMETCSCLHIDVWILWQTNSPDLDVVLEIWMKGARCFICTERFNSLVIWLLWEEGGKRFGTHMFVPEGDTWARCENVTDYLWDGRHRGKEDHSGEEVKARLQTEQLIIRLWCFQVCVCFIYTLYAFRSGRYRLWGFVSRDFLPFLHARTHTHSHTMWSKEPFLAANISLCVRAV